MDFFWQLLRLYKVGCSCGSHDVVVNGALGIQRGASLLFAQAPLLYLRCSMPVAELPLLARSKARELCPG